MDINQFTYIEMDEMYDAPLQTTTWPFFRLLHIWWTFPETHVVKSSLWSNTRHQKSFLIDTWDIDEPFRLCFMVIHYISTFFFFFKKWGSIWPFYDLCASVEWIFCPNESCFKNKCDKMISSRSFNESIINLYGQNPPKSVLKLLI